MMTLSENLEALAREMTEEEYKRWRRNMRRLSNEREELHDAIEILEEDPNNERDALRAKKKRARLARVEQLLIDEKYRKGTLLK